MNGLGADAEVLANGVTVLAKRTSTTPAVTLIASAFGPGPCTTPRSDQGSRTSCRGRSIAARDRIRRTNSPSSSTIAAVTLTVGQPSPLSRWPARASSRTSTTCSRWLRIVMRADVSRRRSRSRRGEIVTLIRQDEDNPAAVAVETLMAMLYGARIPCGAAAARNGRQRRADRPTRAAAVSRHGTAPPAAVAGCRRRCRPADRAIDAARSVFRRGAVGRRLEVTDAPAAAAGGRRVASSR